MKRLVIDLGHGGHDPGAIGPNKTYESIIVLKIGSELSKLLKNYEIETKFTRLSDTFLSLEYCQISVPLTLEFVLELIWIDKKKYALKSFAIFVLSLNETKVSDSLVNLVSIS